MFITFHTSWVKMKQCICWHWNRSETGLKQVSKRLLTGLKQVSKRLLTGLKQGLSRFFAKALHFFNRQSSLLQKLHFLHGRVYQRKDSSGTRKTGSAGLQGRIFRQLFNRKSQPGNSILSDRLVRKCGFRVLLSS